MKFVYEKKTKTGIAALLALTVMLFVGNAFPEHPTTGTLPANPMAAPLPTVAAFTPYLQTPTATSIYVCWQTSSGTESSVLYGTSRNALTSTATGTVYSFNSTTIWHWAKLTGLTPDTRYYYVAKTGTSLSDTLPYHTQPQDTASTGHVRFLVSGDTRTYPGKYKEVNDSMLSTMLRRYGADYRDSINMMVNVGDIVSSGGTISQYKTEFLDPVGGLSKYFPVMVSIGNHEGENANYYNYVKYEDMVTGTEAEKYFSFRIGKILFIIFNSNTGGNAQATWIGNQLTTADADPMVDWVFLFAHHPGKSEMWPDGNSSWVQTTVIPLLAAHPKADFIIYGHAHNYERGQLRTSPLRLMLTGGGGAELDRWGMYGNTIDLPEISKSFDHYCWSYFDFDISKKTYQSICYSLGTDNKALANVPVDTIIRDKIAAGPSKPTALADSLKGTVQVLRGSPIQGPYPLYTSQFQIFSAATGGTALKDSTRDKENIFGAGAAPNYTPIDKMRGVDISQLAVPGLGLTNGTTYWYSLRYRDNNLQWSAWSDRTSFRPGFVTMIAASPAQTTEFSFCLVPRHQSFVIAGFNEPVSVSVLTLSGRQVFKSGRIWNASRSATISLEGVEQGPYMVSVQRLFNQHTAPVVRQLILAD